MKLLALVALFSSLLVGQTTAPPGATIVNYSPTSWGVFTGSLSCYFYSQVPAPGKVESFCMMAGTYPDIEIFDAAGMYTKQSCFVDPANGSICWMFTNTPTGINFQLTGAISVLDGIPIVCCGPFVQGTF